MQENETRKEQNGDAPQDEVFSKSLSDNVKTLSPAQLVLKRFFRSKLSVVGLAVLLTLFLVCFIGPLFFPNMDYETPDLDGGLEVTTTRIEYTVDGVKYEMYDVVYTPVINKLSYPSAKHWLGTDENGRDVLMRLMYGGRISLTIGFVVVILETLVGVLLGGLAGYFGGVVDQIVMRIVDIFYCIPQMPILFICSALLSANQVNGYARIYK